MTNKKYLLDTIASYSLDVTLAVGNATARAAIVLILSLSEPALDASAVPWLARSNSTEASRGIGKRSQFRALHRSHSLVNPT
jgi:hypothetical protein